MKMINILLIVIFILFAILGIKVYTSNKEPEYSLQEIQEILDRAEDIKNYECDIEQHYGGYEYYKRLENKIYLEDDDKVKTIIDYDKNIAITYDENKKIYVQGKPFTDYVITSNHYTGGIQKNDITTIEGFKEVLSIKEEKYKDVECLKVEIKLKTNNVIMWINIENGLIMKIKYLYENIEDEIYEYTYKFNTVTDNDVNPDLTGYKKVEANS